MRLSGAGRGSACRAGDRRAVSAGGRTAARAESARWACAWRGLATPSAATRATRAPVARGPCGSRAPAGGGGSVWESNPPDPTVSGHDRFEDDGSHQAPSAPPGPAGEHVYATRRLGAGSREGEVTSPPEARRSFYSPRVMDRSPRSSTSPMTAAPGTRERYSATRSGGTARSSPPGRLRDPPAGRAGLRRWFPTPPGRPATRRCAPRRRCGCRRRGRARRPAGGGPRTGAAAG